MAKLTSSRYEAAIFYDRVSSFGTVPGYDRQTDMHRMMAITRLLRRTGKNGQIFARSGQYLTPGATVIKMEHTH